MSVCKNINMAAKIVCSKPHLFNIHVILKKISIMWSQLLLSLFVWLLHCWQNNSFGKSATCSDFFIFYKGKSACYWVIRKRAFSMVVYSLSNIIIPAEIRALFLVLFWMSEDMVLPQDLGTSEQYRVQQVVCLIVVKLLGGVIVLGYGVFISAQCHCNKHCNKRRGRSSWNGIWDQGSRFNWELIRVGQRSVLSFKITVFLLPTQSNLYLISCWRPIKS